MHASTTGTTGDVRPADWMIPGGHPSLEGHEVHIWKVELSASPAQLDAMRTLLSDDERGRADRFRFERHRRRFMVGRAAMRILLGRYTGQQPETLDFTYNAQGKPALETAGSPVFNFTNSRDLALLCVARQGRLGIDLEHLGRHADYAGIVKRFFSEREIDELFSLPESRRHAAFLTGWTRKEAYIKALGTGLSLPLDRFTVNIDPHIAPVLISAGDRPDEQGSWTFRHLEPEPGYVASLAVEGQGCDPGLYCWQV